MKNPRKPKAKTYRTLKIALDKAWSRLVRRRAADDRGIARCCSCGATALWKALQCGHFVSRVRLATRWLERNTAPQCVRCNIFLRGNPVGYARWLEREYGPGIFASLDEQSRQPVKFTRADLQAKLDETLKAIKELSQS